MDDTTQNTNPQDEEVLESADEQTTASDTTEDTYESPQEANKEVLELMELEASIKNLHAGIDMKRSEIKKINDMIKDTLENDKTYMEHDEKVQAAKRVLKQTKDQLMQISSVKSSIEDLKEMREDMKDAQSLLSKSLLRYAQLVDDAVITMSNGDAYLVKKLAKLVKQSSKYTA